MRRWIEHNTAIYWGTFVRPRGEDLFWWDWTGVQVRVGDRVFYVTRICL